MIQYVFGYVELSLQDIASFRNGKGHEKNISKDGKYVVVNSKFVSSNGNTKKLSDTQLSPLYKNDITLVMSDLPNGKALAKCYFIETDDEFTLNQRIGALSVKNFDMCEPKYLFYLLNRNKGLLKYDNGVDQTNLKKDDILNLKLVIPSTIKQKRIVDILDKFDSLCNDSTQGLQLEIQQRQKQYEYYRDKVLSFKGIN